eukprot:TRINITY_DN1452_c0_g1_i2.p1 TRINITY_DN1452_c0_g1~~TRINITY_DN1452_c0_g1_i2.p1  ORF type:complete len:401 (-),score=104.33 TRINITY_DN1452_c0_g1_i2:18-1220(-)
MEFAYSSSSHIDFPNLSNSPLFMLGQSYSKSNDSIPERAWSDFLTDFRSCFWFTYRKNFIRIEPSGLTSDVGWGCMLRSGQMLLSQALIYHYFGRSFRIFDLLRNSDDSDDNNNRDAKIQRYFNILDSFIDYPDKPYSIHNIAEGGLRFGKDIGEWFGPATIAQVLEGLVEQQFDIYHEFCMYVSVDSCVYLDRVQDLCSRSNFNSNSNNKGKEKEGDREEEQEEEENKNWKSMLIVIPVRLGLDKLNDIYVNILKEMFKFPQSMGILGGKPRSSYYFIGCQDESILYLDPHVLQATVSSNFEEEKKKGGEEGSVFNSYYCSNPKKMSFLELDPSMAFAFYCKTRRDFEDWCERSKEMSERLGTTVFNIEKRTPEYLIKKKEVITKEKFFSDDEDEVVFL